MCLQCLNNKPINRKKEMRVKLWQLDHIYHCVIIGTCLTLVEVKKILNGLKVDCNYNAYEVHTKIVTLSANNNYCSKRIQNYLDKKLSLAIKKTRKMNCCELKEEWRNVLKTGDFLGTFWALLSHPYTDETMRRFFYGDIHMLSHLSGASNRVDLKKLNQLEQKASNWSKVLSTKDSENEQLKILNLQQADSIRTQENFIEELSIQIKKLAIKNEQLVRWVSIEFVGWVECNER